MKPPAEWADFVARFEAAAEAAGFAPAECAAYVRYRASEVLGFPVCRECGCTDFTACDDGCEWVDIDLCSACADGDEA